MNKMRRSVKNAPRGKKQRPASRAPDVKTKFLQACKLRLCRNAPVAMALIFLAGFAVLGAWDRPAPLAAAQASVSAVTDKLVYHPGDTATFNITVDSGGQAISGDLVLKVYPPVSPASANPVGGQPLTQLSIRNNFKTSGKESLQFGTSLDSLGVSAGGYPVRVSLMGPGGEQAGATAWLAVVDAGAHAPLDLVIVWPVSSPPERNPAGQFENTALVTRCQASPEAPDSILQNWDLSQKYPQIKTTYAIEPSLLDQLDVMSRGFQLQEGSGVRTLAANSPEATAAGGCLDSLKQLAASGNSEILATPYTFASLPLLAKDGWEDGNGQFRIGRDVESGLLGLGQDPQGGFAPGLMVTTDSLHYLADTGSNYTVLPGSFRGSIQAGPDLAGAVSYRLRDLSGERITAFFAADDASAALLGSQPDPQAFFAALANDYAAGGQANPVIVAPEVLAPALSAQQRDQIYAAIKGAPWLNTMTLADANNKYRPSTEPATLFKYVDTVSGYVSQTYYQNLTAAHRLFEAYREAVDSDQLPMMSLSRKMFAAETGYWTGPGADPGSANQGLAYLSDIINSVHAEFSRLSIGVSLPLLQGTGSGEADVTVKNGNSYPVTADIVVEAGGVNFPRGSDQRTQLKPGLTVMKFPYRDAGWSRLNASIKSNGVVLAGDSATIHPISGRVWIVLGVAGAALMIGVGYVFLIVKRR